MWYWSRGGFGLLIGLCLILSDAKGQGFLERLEQRVRDGLRPGSEDPQAAVPAADPAKPVASANAPSSGATNSGVPSASPPATGAPTVGPTAPLAAGGQPSAPEAIPGTGNKGRPTVRPLDPPAEPAILGLELEEIIVPGGGLTVTKVNPRSPAEAAGFRPNDVLLMIGGRPVLKLNDVMEVMATHRPGDRLTLRLRREGQTLETTALLAGAAKPASTKDRPNDSSEPSVLTSKGRIGVEVDDLATAGSTTPVQSGAVVITVQSQSPAEAAGIRVGDIIVAVDGKLITGVRSMVQTMNALKPGQSIEVTYYSGNQMFRKNLLVAGPDGQISNQASAEIRKKNESNPAVATTGESSGFTGWIGGIGKMFSVSGKTESAAPTGSAAPASPATSTATLVPPATAVDPTRENEELKSTVKKLEDRIAELERQLKTGPK